MKNRYFKSMMDLLFPRRCLNCGKSETYSCQKCLSELHFLENQCCPHCRKTTLAGHFCNKSCAYLYQFDQLIVALEYDKSGFLKKMIVRFKYKFSKELSEVLANILLTQIINVFGGFEDCYEKIVIVPVPIHKKKMRQRGFNQSHLLASHLAKKFDLKMIDCLRRTKCTNSQAMLGRSERLQNVVNSMKIAKGVEQKNLRRKMVLIIDDIATTGSTLNECARILKENGVSWVCGLVIARSR